MKDGRVYESITEALQSPQDATIIRIANTGPAAPPYPMPAELATLTNLEELSINCWLPEFAAVPDFIGDLKKLKILTISGPITQISPRIGELKLLEQLYLGCDMAALPDEIMQLERLEELRIASNHINKLPENIDLLKSLRKLDISGTAVVHLPPSLGDLPDLASVSLAVCRSLDLEQAFDVLSRLPNLRELRLNWGEFTTLPAKLGDCRALEFLDVSDNRHLQYLGEGMKPLPKWNTVRVDRCCTDFKKALKKLLPGGRLINKWTYEDQFGGGIEFSDIHRYIRKGAELIWDGMRVIPLP